MSATITDHELQIPGRFVTLFRLSLIDEVQSDTDRAKENSADLAEFYIADADDHNADTDTDDVRVTLENHLENLNTACCWLSDDHSLLERISRHQPSPGQDLTIRGPFETLHGALQATIRRAAQDLVDAGVYSPIEGARVLHRAAAATWAAEECSRLNEEHGLSSEAATDTDDEAGVTA